MDTHVLTICGVAFAAVFILLTILSIIQRIITALFPADAPEPAATRKPAVPPGREAAPPRAAQASPGPAADPAVVAVITGAVMNLYPHARVTRIEEER